ncbi:glycosyltransferase family 4 protein [Flavivirga algicola]|uniref:Glycosyltransferase family 4 protein n=1 Tax=Flavivirga algicola TaxID=2729136 RepID=A0ABX1RS09_9FLAO|nr:glycosyltransferase family 4 protein [Flavivirga algicola]NMH86339.1 glycosyltransferase family 4 protein [Flavivirga algicola]
MKVIQIIDSLNAGGAERVAVNIANELADNDIESFICTTRKEGILKDNIRSNVKYLFLSKKGRFDIMAIKTLRLYIKTHKIDIIHAHSSSFFIAILVKLFQPKLKVIWHDHYGNSEFLNERPIKILKLVSKKFNHILAVNTILKSWAELNLNVKNVSYIPNFVDINLNEEGDTKLSGNNSKRIVCLANLRPQKDHITLLNAIKKVFDQFSDWSLHLIGKDFSDEYSKELKTIMKKLNLDENVYIYGSRKDIYKILLQCDIGVLSSKSEGLPLSLLEYGLAKLPVIVTDVGQCKEVISSNKLGRIVEANNEDVLSEAIIKLIKDRELMRTLGNNLYSHISKQFGKDSIVKSIIKIYKEVLC